MKKNVNDGLSQYTYYVNGMKSLDAGHGTGILFHESLVGTVSMETNI